MKTKEQKQLQISRLITEFTAKMDVTLRMNLHKPGWENDHLRGLLSILQEDVAGLSRAMTYVDNRQVCKKAVDVANLAAMIWDNAVRLVESEEAPCDTQS